MSGEPQAPAPAELPEEGQNSPEGEAPAEEVSESRDEVERGVASDPEAKKEERPQGGVSPKQEAADASKGKGGPSKKGQKPDAPEPVAGAYHVALPTFEGPLDLLLHLIQQHELDIKDIPISFISEKYVEYIMLMQDLNIDLASEYLVMAATLAHIKSKMLLPKPPADQDDDGAEELDPRSELVRRLLEYQKYKNAAEQLGSAPVLGRDVFLRGAPAPMVDGPAPLAQVSVFKLFDAFQKLLSKAKQQADHLIDVDRISISERIIELTDLLRNKGRVPFSELFDESMTRSDLIVSFLAVLEMTRLRMMVVLQAGPLQPIEIELTLASEHDDILATGLEGTDPLAELSRLGDEKEAGISEVAASEPEDGEPEPSPSLGAASDEGQPLEPDLPAAQEQAASAPDEEKLATPSQDD